MVALGRPYDRIRVAPRVMAEVAENSAMLVGQTGKEVCAGPPAMIDEILELLAVGGSRGDPGPITALLPAPERLLDYAEAVDDLVLWELVTALRAHELVRTLGGLPDGDTWAAGYARDGFATATWPLLAALDAPSVEAMVAGLAPLRSAAGRRLPRPGSGPAHPVRQGVGHPALRHVARCVLHQSRQNSLPSGSAMMMCPASSGGAGSCRWRRVAP
ncbi:hypothetical protein [Sphaerisporangium aureirubrum]|uniref:Uncharacterized protein n=1 Tax=Sphaerisporangium aureirubrum TaxID=1544736 RepID=A0ABW1NHF8_9ACTN